MEYIDKNKKFWDEHFAKISLNYPNEEVIRFLARCKGLYQNGVMLDWGCASGRHTVLGCNFGFQVIAADYVERCVNQTREKVKLECVKAKGKVVQYIVNKGSNIEEIEDETLDMIVAWGVIFYNTLEQQKLMLKNMCRMLKKGGRVFCDFRTQRDSIYLQQEKCMSKEEFTISAEDTRHKGLYLGIYSLADIKEMVKESGLTIENIELYELTQDNQNTKNSWWHITLLKI